MTQAAAGDAGQNAAGGPGDQGASPGAANGQAAQGPATNEAGDKGSNEAGGKGANDPGGKGDGKGAGDGRGADGKGGKETHDGPDGSSDSEGDSTSLEARTSGASGSSANAGKVHEQLRRASRMLIRGDMVGGDKFVFLTGDRQPAPLREITPMLADPVRHAFVEPENWTETRSRFRDRRLAVLRGDPGQGRVAAAIRLLQVPSDRTIFNLDRDVDLQRLPQWMEANADGEKPLPLGAGFVLCQPTTWTEIRGWMLHQIAAALDRLDARMVVTVDTDVALSDEEVRDFVIPLGRAQQHRAVLSSHLRWRLDQRADVDATAADRILSDERMRTFLDEVLTADAPVKTAADLAMMIDQEYDGLAVDVERLRARMTERSVEDFDIWFGGLPDVPTRSLAIALAVLNGLPFESVARAADRLAERLDGPPQVVAPAAPALQPPWRDPFADTRRERLRLLQARTRSITVQGDFGRTPVEIVEYFDQGRAGTVLEHVWHQYQLHRPLLEWLRDLADDPVEDVRIWTGTALGLLCTYSFDFVYTNVLRDMTTDTNRRLRDVVAYALRIPAADSRFTPLVRRIANRLHGNRDLPLGQATSARIRGLSLGPADVDGALRWLDRLAILDDYRIAWAIGDSLADLLVHDHEANAPVVLDRLTTWLNDRRRDRVGQYIFHQLASSLVSYVEMKGSDTAPSSWATWPALLYLADQRPDLRAVLVGLWGRVLNTGMRPDRVSGAIDGWAAWAESYPDVRTAFVRMLVATAALTPRTHTILLRHAAHWHAPDNLYQLPETARAVEKALNARNDVP